MPELPEVETVRRGLVELIVGKTVKATSHDTDKSFPNTVDDVSSSLLGAQVTAVRRRAKVLLIDLSTNYSLVVHLKMTGQMVFVSQAGPAATSPPENIPVKLESFSGAAPRDVTRESQANERFGAGHPNDSLIGELPDRSTRVTIDFIDGSQLFFNDQRKFGWMKLMPTLEIPNIDFMKRVGPEPLEANFTTEEFRARFLRRARTNIKAALLDQSVVAGVGNIYADESLWGAQIHPTRLVSSITPDEFHSLYSELRAVMNLAIEKGGSTDKNYVNAEGKRGSYMDFARVFRRKGQACPRCGQIILKIRVAGRGTHYCPHCQQP